MTLNEIVSQLETIATNHRQINTFGFGDIWEIASSGDIQYPLMWVNLEGVDISTRDKTEIYRFSFLFMDTVKNGEVNETEVLSDQLSIAKDVLAQLRHPNYEWSFEENSSSLEDFTERFVDSVSGWRVPVSLKLPYLSNRCDAPYSGNTSTSGTCPVVTIYSSAGAVLTTVVSGGSYTVAACDLSGTYNIYVNGALNQTGTSADLTNETFNISP